MGFFDNVKQKVDNAKQLGKDTIKEVGVGLEAQEQYQRAYDKGVFIKNYGSAAKDFEKAWKKFQKENNSEMSLRAQANSALYALLDSKDRSCLNDLINKLELLPEIEPVGTKTTMAQTGPLVTELKAILLEYQAEQVQSTGEKKPLYSQASDILMALGTEALSFADKIGVSGPVDKALLRAYYYGALSDYYGALTEAMVSPAHAHDYFQKSAVRFRQAGATDWSSKVEGCLDQIKMKRHCWMCGREMQGRNIYYQYYPASTTMYHKNLLEGSGDDIGMVDTENCVTLCTVCGSSIEKQADIYASKRANEVREWVAPILQNYAEVFENHANRLRDLERYSHSHN
jgi:hypothetical protein